LKLPSNRKTRNRPRTKGQWAKGDPGPNEPKFSPENVPMFYFSSKKKIKKAGEGY